MTNRTPWTPAENRALVSLYFEMLDRAQAGQPYNKAAMIRDSRERYSESCNRIAGALFDRTRGSIEAKLMNATAAHRELEPGAVTMDGYGYRALANYQRDLGRAMACAIVGRVTGEGYDYGDELVAFHEAEGDSLQTIVAAVLAEAAA